MFPDITGIFGEEHKGTEFSSRELVSSPFSADSGKLFALSLGGSIVAGEQPNIAVIAKLGESISRLHADGFRFAIVVGGGIPCRSYVSAARALGANNFFQDELGIAFTRINAALLCSSLELAYPVVQTKINHARSILDAGKIPVYGGMIPGQTTDAVAALLAESLGACFVNLSNVDGIYSSNPRTNPRAKLYDHLSYARLFKLLQQHGSQPGQNLVLDIPACLILQRSGIRSLFLNGNNIENFEAAIRGQAFTGTLVEEKPGDISETGVEDI